MQKSQPWIIFPLVAILLLALIPALQLLPSSTASILLPASNVTNLVHTSTIVTVPDWLAGQNNWSKENEFDPQCSGPDGQIGLSSHGIGILEKYLPMLMNPSTVIGAIIATEGIAVLWTGGASLDLILSEIALLEGYTGEFALIQASEVIAFIKQVVRELTQQSTCYRMPSTVLQIIWNFIKFLGGSW